MIYISADIFFHLKSNADLSLTDVEDSGRTSLKSSSIVMDEEFS